MNLDTTIQDQPVDDLNRFFLYSIGFHVLLIVLFFWVGRELKSMLFPNSKLLNNVQLIQSSVRVDIVAMPTKSLKELENQPIVAPPEVGSKGEEISEEKPIEVVEPKPEEIKNEIVFEEANKKVEEPTIEKPESEPQKKPIVTEKPKESFDDFLKKLGSKKIENKGIKNGNKNVKDSKGTSQIDFGAKITSLKGLVNEGNKLASGTSLTEAEGVSDGVANTYLESLSQTVKPHWKLPSYLMDQNLQCRIQLFLSREGKILKSEVSESSGNTEYDQMALEAVKKVGSFGTLPNNLVDAGISGRIVLGFPL